MIDYDTWLTKDYERAENLAHARESAEEEFVQCMDGGSKAYREYVEVDEICDLFDAIRAKLGETTLTLSLRQAQVQILIVNFQNEIGERYVQENADAQEAIEWHDDFPGDCR